MRALKQMRIILLISVKYTIIIVLKSYVIHGVSDNPGQSAEKPHPPPPFSTCTHCYCIYTRDFAIITYSIVYILYTWCIYCDNACVQYLYVRKPATTAYTALVVASYVCSIHRGYVYVCPRIACGQICIPKSLLSHRRVSENTTTSTPATLGAPDLSTRGKKLCFIKNRSLISVLNRA